MISEGRKFSKESSIYVIGEILSKSLSFLLLPIYTSYLSTEDFSILMLVMMIWPVVVVLIGKGFSTYIIRGLYEYTDKKRFLGTVLCFSLFIGLIVALGIHLIGPWLFNFIFKEVDYKPYLQFGVFFAVFRLFFNHVISIYRAKRQAVTSVALSFVQFFTQFSAVFISIFILKTDLLGILRSFVIAYGIVAVIYTIKVAPELRFPFQWDVIKPGLLFVIPLIPHALSSWSVNYIGRIFIERHMSLVDLAVYSLASQIALILCVLNNGLNQAWVPFIYTNAKKSGFNQLFKTNARKLLVVIFLLGGVIFLFSKELLMIMGKSDYMAAQTILPIFLLSYVFQILYFIHVVIIFYQKQTKLIPLITLGAGFICILLNIWLVPIWKMYGAALCTLVSFFIMYVIAKKISQKYIDVTILDWRIVVFILSVLSILTGSYFLIDTMFLMVRIGLKLMVSIGFIGIMQFLNLFNLKDFLQTFFNVRK